MSVAYSVLAMAFSLMGAASMKGSVTGRAAPPLHKGMSVLNAVGAVLFSNSAGIIVIDVSARRTWRAPRLRPAQFGGRGTLVGGEAACAERPVSFIPLQNARCASSPPASAGLTSSVAGPAHGGRAAGQQDWHEESSRCGLWTVNGASLRALGPPAGAQSCAL